MYSHIFSLMRAVMRSTLLTWIYTGFHIRHLHIYTLSHTHTHTHTLASIACMSGTCIYTLSRTHTHTLASIAFISGTCTYTLSRTHTHTHTPASIACMSGHAIRTHNLFYFFNTVNKSECIKHVVFECALNVLSWDVALSPFRKKLHCAIFLYTPHTHTHLITHMFFTAATCDKAVFFLNG